MTGSLKCRDCGSIVELYRRDNRTLGLICDCATVQKFDVEGGIPEEWTG